MPQSYNIYSNLASFLQYFLAILTLIIRKTPKNTSISNPRYTTHNNRKVYHPPQKITSPSPNLQNSSYLCPQIQILTIMKKYILYPIYVAILLALLYISKVGPIVMSFLNAIISSIHNRGLILCIIAAILIITIEILRKHYPIPNPKREKRPITTTPLFFDQPTSDDKYGRKTSANLLIEKIFSTFNASQADKGSFVININESYGYGKTSFLQILNIQLEVQDQPYHIINFRPWLCDNDQAIIKEFFTLLCIKLKDYSLNNDISQYLALLLEESSQLTPWWTKIPLSLFSKTIKPYTLKGISFYFFLQYVRIGCLQIKLSQPNPTRSKVRTLTDEI